MVTQSVVEELAKQLVQASQSHRVLNWEPFQKGLTKEEEGYEVQQVVYRQLHSGVAAYKVSLTSEKAQKGYSYDQPVYGQLDDKQVHESNSTVTLSSQFSPFLEVEIAFRVKKVPNTNDSLNELLHKVDVLASFELPDSRFKNWFRKLNKALFMADDAMANQLIYGIHNKSSVSVSDLADITMILEHDGRMVGNASAKSVLGNPLNSLKWLVQKLDSKNKVLKVGQVITSGTAKTVTLTKGTWKATYSHGLGYVQVNVVD